MTREDNPWEVTRLRVAGLASRPNLVSMDGPRPVGTVMISCK